LEIHLTGLLDNQEINSFKNKQESKNNSTEEKHESRKNIPINKENISNKIQKPSIQEEITHKELIEKKDDKLEKFEVIKKESIENITENNQNNLGSNNLKLSLS